MGERKLLDIVDGVYAAATGAQPWQPVLQQVCDAFGATAAGMRFEMRDPAAFRQTWVGLEPSFESAYVQHYWRSDPWVELSAHIDVGRARTSEAVVSRAELQRSEFYSGMCVPFELDDLVGGVIERSPRQLVSFGVMKQARGKPFGTDSMRDLEILLPHFRRAIEIERRLAAAQPSGRIAWRLVDELPVGVVIVNAAGRVVRTNRAADRMFGDGFALERGKLTAQLAAPPLRRQLEAALAGRMPASAVSIAVPRTSDKPSYRATVVPIGADDALLDGLQPPAALVVITDPAAEVVPPALILTQRFGLTPAESRVAVHLGRGASPRETADVLGVAYNTVRFQLRQIYAKTGTANQAALVKLLVLVGLGAFIESSWPYPPTG